MSRKGQTELVQIHRVTAIVLLISSIVFCAGAQTNQINSGSVSNSTAAHFRPSAQAAEKIRTDCIRSRRCLCGMILKVVPDGLIVDSGYTNLLHASTNAFWLVPGSTAVSRSKPVIEAAEPGCPCVGLVFISDLPKKHGATVKPKQYDYVVLTGYPAGHYVYTSVGTVQKTVRRFSASLLKAVDLNLAAEEKSAGDVSVPH
jgi:hypothetical protein